MAEWDHVADLQRMFSDDDALNEQIQQHLLLFESGFDEARADALAERGQARQHLLSSEPLAA